MSMVLLSFIGLEVVGKMHGLTWLRALTLSHIGAEISCLSYQARERYLSKSPLTRLQLHTL